MKTLILGSLFAITAAASLPAAADTITFAGSTEISNAVFSASAVFEINDDQLVITLRNTSPSTNRFDTPGRTLSGLFWAFDGGVFPLTPVSAMLASGSSITCGSCGPDYLAGENNVGGEFGYRVEPEVGGSDYFVSSANYGKTGFRPNFGGENLSGPAGLGGIDFGIVSPAPGYAPNPNGTFDDMAVVMGGVRFEFSGARGLSVNDIINVNFLPGTVLQGNNVPASVVPEPASIALFGLGLAGFAAARRRRNQVPT